MLVCLECGSDLIKPRNQKTCPGACRKARRNRSIAQWKADHADRVARRAAEYYREDPERQKAASKAWKAKNPKRAKELAREHRKISYRRRAEHYKARNRAFIAANPDLHEFYRGRGLARVRKAKRIFDQLAEINPAVYEAVAGAKDKGRAMLRALKEMGIEIDA